jgi:Ca2+-dependent lipid-binding protein
MDKYSEASVLKAVNAMCGNRDEKLFLPTKSYRNSIVLAQNPRNKRLFKIKVIVPIIVILALILTTIFIVKKQEIIGSPENLIHNNEDIDDTDLYRNVSKKLNEIQVEKTIETINFSTTKTIGLTTTEETVKPSTTTIQSTTTKEIDYILATVTVNRATVPDIDYSIFNKVSDPFVDLLIDGIKIGSTNVIEDNNNPQWNYHFVHQIKLSVDSVITFEIFDKDLTKNEYIGGLTVKISQLVTDGLNGKITHQNYGSGSLWFTVSWTEVYKSY